MVGRGPSLQWLTKASFSHGDGPVICINTAILAVQQLGLNNDIYSMQKDGCTSYHQRDVGCDGCDGEKGLMVYPNADVTLLLHEHESKNCLPNHESRIVFDSIEDLGFEWWMTSSPCAIRIAKIMGCSCIVLLCHDSLFNDLRTVETETGDMFELKQYPEHNYLGIIPLVEKELQGIAHEIVSPEETR